MLQANLMAGDADYHKRQCMVMDKQGNASVINGDENIAYTGNICIPHFAVAGNMLGGMNVLSSFIRSVVQGCCDNADAVLAGDIPIYKTDYESVLPDILIDGLGQALSDGGDKRGTYSASLRIESYSFAPIDIRVDWSDDNLIGDMHRILSRVRSDDFQAFLSGLPNE